MLPEQSIPQALAEGARTPDSYPEPPKEEQKDEHQGHPEEPDYSRSLFTQSTSA